MAVAEQLAAYRGPVRGTLLRLVKDEALADDLVQEALLRATGAAASLRGESAPSTWLTAIAINLARDHFRSLKRRPPTETLDQAEELPDQSSCAEGEILRAGMSACILGHVETLSERQREAVLLHYFAGLDHCEIAATLGVSRGNARVILHRGLAALRESLSRECHLDFDDEVPCDRR